MEIGFLFFNIFSLEKESFPLTPAPPFPPKKKYFYFHPLALVDVTWYYMVTRFIICFVVRLLLKIAKKCSALVTCGVTCDLVGRYKYQKISIINIYSAFLLYSVKCCFLVKSFFVNSCLMAGWKDVSWLWQAYLSRNMEGHSRISRSQVRQQF
jgi:hypothetical protein